MNRVRAIVVRGLGLAVGLFGLALTYNLWVPVGSRVGALPMRGGLVMFLGPVLLTAGVFLLLVTRVSRRTADAADRQGSASWRLWLVKRV